MASQLRYGLDSVLELDVPEGALVAECLAPHGDALKDPAAAMRSALAEPLNFPPLSQAVIPGDRVVIAIEADVPQAATIVGAVVESLLGAGIVAKDICILFSAGGPSRLADALLSGLPADLRDQIEVIAHDPAHRDQLSYLAAGDNGEGIYINRRLFDADVVLPIGCVRVEGAPAYFGVGGTLFPTFSDAAALDRFHAPAIESQHDDVVRRRREAHEVAWLLGVMLTIQIVPAAGGGVLHAIAGNAESVERRATDLCKQAWGFEVPRSAELVVAAIEGGEDQQTWENVGRAVAAAARAVADDGAVAVCTELSSQPGPALEWISRARDLPDALRHIRKQHSADATAAHELAALLQRARVYLLSRLEESIVEELGLAPVGEAADIGRLVRRHRSCILLGNAQYAQPTPVAETAEQLS